MMDKRSSFNKLYSEGMNYDDYTKISDRHNERIKLSFNETEKLLNLLSEKDIKRINTNIKVLVIGEKWCGDCANAVPVISHMAKYFNNWQFSIALRDKNEEIVSQYYLTGGRKKIPVVIMADEDCDEVIRWVERPTRSYKIVADLQDERLPKDEYIKKYKSIPELKPPLLTAEIFNNFLDMAFKTTSSLHILPKKK